MKRARYTPKTSHILFAAAGILVVTVLLTMLIAGMSGGTRSSAGTPPEGTDGGAGIGLEGGTGNGSDMSPGAAGGTGEPGAAGRGPGSGPGSELRIGGPGDLDVTELELPNEGRRLRTWSWEPTRDPREKWTQSETERFWYDPEEIGTGYLKEENDKLIDELLEGVP